MTSRTSPARSHRPDEQLPGLVAWAFYDWANTAFATVIQTFVFAAYFTRRVAESETAGSFWWGNTNAAAGLIVAIGGPILGAIADQAGARKPWIAAFTSLCVVATALLWFVQPSPEYTTLAIVLVGIGALGSEFATIFYNAMLPHLARADRIGRWSGWGWSLGYAGGVACLSLALVLFVADDSLLALQRGDASHVRAAFPLVAVWYAFFAIPLFWFTPDVPRARQPLPLVARRGLRQLANSIRRVREYTPIVLFLIAHMIYIDGLATLFIFGGVYAAGTFDFTEQQVLLFGIALNVSAAIGAAGLAWIDDWIGSKPTILLSLVGLMIPGACILVVESPTLFWTFGIVLGLFVGPVQSASRALLSRLAPAPLRNEMFGLYALSGKATSFLGPLLVGWITHLSGSQRIGMSAVLFLLLAGFIVLATVPVRPQSSR